MPERKVLDLTDRSGDFWYPVALSAQVADSPVAVTLLGERVVLARMGGRVIALQDLCVHRGTPLSMGRIDGPLLVCAYHGWSYDADGICVRIPQRAEHPIPRKARVPAYAAEERFGVVWVCLRGGELAIPDFPEYDDPNYRTIFVGVHEWEAGAARMMENFLDVGHLAWIHPGLLGDERRPNIHVSPLQRSDEGFSFRAENEVAGPDDSWRTEPVDYTFTLPYHFGIVREQERVVPEAGNSADRAIAPRYVLKISIQPMQSRQSRRYTWVARNYALDPVNDQRFIDFLLKLADQDRPVVEAQRPEELPLDIAAEMHIRNVDAPAIEFRRMLSVQGLEESSLPNEHLN